MGFFLGGEIMFYLWSLGSSHLCFWLQIIICMALVYLYICDIFINIFSYYKFITVTLFYILKTKKKVEKKKKNTTGKECCDTFGICSHAYFYLEFKITACQNKFLIAIGLHWKFRSLFILLNNDAETQVNELKVMLLHALRKPMRCFLCYYLSHCIDIHLLI